MIDAIFTLRHTGQMIHEEGHEPFNNYGLIIFSWAFTLLVTINSSNTMMYFICY